jgi:SpoVK/Ycf46/Vps4 family AAA+-type ATPase
VHYRAQDTAFQFLTPGMLTKIHDLRDAARSIFIIATNYESRIDPAIKRSGRIDRKYLLLPPDAARRIEMVRERGVSLKADAEQSVARYSLYLGFTEIKGACAKAKRDGGEVERDLSRAERSTGAEFYGRRAYIDDPFPVQEAACLYLLAKEVDLLSGHDPKGFREHFEAGVDRSAIGEKKDPPASEQKEHLWVKIEKRAEEIQAAAKADP